MEMRRPIWCVFPGFGSMWKSVDFTSLTLIPVFKSAIEKCHAALMEKNFDLLAAINSKKPNMDCKITYFTCITATQIALVDTLKATGVIISGMIGHSHGEIACAYADNCFSVREAILMSYAKAVSMSNAQVPRGRMIAVNKGYEHVKQICPPELSISAHNGPNSCCISGLEKDIVNFIAVLKKANIRSLPIDSKAYHTTIVSPIWECEEQILRQIPIPTKARTSKWVSTAFPENEWDKENASNCGIEYFHHNFVNSVLFEEAVRHIPQNAIVLEMGPAIFQTILIGSLPNTVLIMEMLAAENNAENIRNVLRRLQEEDVDVDLSIIAIK